MAPSQDELALTATAPVATAASRGGRVGRFELERVLGQGGMGVVHAAFDPELERRVALKVLRQAASAGARARLLREARAMAQLSHPNVITVFEVGSADGEDFVAMELVAGGTLGEWVRDARPRWREIVAAFAAAGGGLAAAHAEGLVHRDFKPNNVLRGDDGRIVVTDFGLARSPERGEPVLEVSSDATVTPTGAVLGTPAYMAPEQWTGVAVEAAADQFAFCVALWEALAGARPFRGTTVAEIRDGVLAGPVDLPAGAIPRPLRAILRRGLARDPARRWPTMAALLDALQRVVGRRRRVAIAGAAAIVAAGVVALVVAARRDREDACASPVDLDAAWSPAREAAFAAASPEAAKLVAGDVAALRALRPKACEAAPAVRAARLACFDAVEQRLVAGVASAERDRAIDGEAMASVLVDPTVCDRDAPPALAATTPELAAAFALLERAYAGTPRPTPAELDAVAARAASPCARALGLKARLVAMSTPGEAPADLGGFVRDAQTVTELRSSCDDAAIRAALAVELVDPSEPETFARAEAELAGFPDLAGGVEANRGERAQAAERWDEAAQHLTRAIELFGRRGRTRSQLEAVRHALKLAYEHGRAEDAARLYATWHPVAERLGRRAAAPLEAAAARHAWHVGDVAAADAALESLRARGDIPNLDSPGVTDAVDVSGDVVDELGRPVPDAVVATAFVLVGDEVTIGTPIFAFDPRSTRTDASGHFAIAGARGTIAAQAGIRRSPTTEVAPSVHLVVAPTTEIEGTVDHGTIPPEGIRVVIRAVDSSTVMLAPVRPDGRFHVAGVPRGKVEIAAARGDTIVVGASPRPLAVGSQPIRGVALAVSDRRLRVIARSNDVSRPDGAMIWLYPRFVAVDHPTVLALAKRGVKTAPVIAMPIDPKDVDPAAGVAADDLVATIHDRPPGELMACAFGFAKKQVAEAASIADYGTAMLDLELGCTRVAAAADVVTVDVPPIRKLPARK